MYEGAILRAHSQARMGQGPSGWVPRRWKAPRFVGSHIPSRGGGGSESSACSARRGGDFNHHEATGGRPGCPGDVRGGELASRRVLSSGALDPRHRARGESLAAVSVARWSSGYPPGTFFGTGLGARWRSSSSRKRRTGDVERPSRKRGCQRGRGPSPRARIDRSKGVPTCRCVAEVDGRRLAQRSATRIPPKPRDRLRGRSLALEGTVSTAKSGTSKCSGAKTRREMARGGKIARPRKARFEVRGRKRRSERGGGHSPMEGISDRKRRSPFTGVVGCSV